MARTYGNNASRGYNRTHWKLRARWKPLVDSGQVKCHADLCLEERDGGNRWIPPGAPWHMGHTADRSGWTGPEHQRCGASDGARRGNQDRPRHLAIALPGRDVICKDCGKPYHYPAKQCTICGRHYHPSRGVQYTCSRQCGIAYRRLGGYAPRPLPACEVCGKPCRTYGSRTCSPACRDAQRTELTCERCSKKFMGISARYCSSNCRALAYYQANREEQIAKQLARYYAKDGRVALPSQARVRTPLEGTASRPRGERCADCGRQVWRSETNRVSSGWACASCRRKRMTATAARMTGMTANQSRAW